ncbi:MAG: hypothetical protein NT067_06520 [Candidatus Diapherotrites archaeon]|nr:hypothetical protein [Candidatus Diapherotrites archaeon]
MDGCKMKKTLVLLFFLLVLGAAAAKAQDYKITSHEINVDIDKDGYASVRERYYMVFDNKQSAEEFQQLKNNNLKFDLDKWADFDPELKINFGLRADIKDLLIDFADEPSGELLYYAEFKYSFNLPAFNKKSGGEAGRKILFEINKTFIRPLTHGTDFVIPEWATMRFILPPQSEPETPLVVSPMNPKVSVDYDAQDKRKMVEVRGYFASNDFAFGFSYYEAIAPSFSIAMLVKDFTEKTQRETQITLGFVLVLVGLALFALRKKIEARVSGFIIKNSNLAQGETDEPK